MRRFMLVNGSKHIALFPGDTSSWITIQTISNRLVSFSFENSDFIAVSNLDIVLDAICAVPWSVRRYMLEASVPKESC
jgi:hypothetical protein